MTERMTSDEALDRAIDLLNQAQDETDRGLMERYGALADSWLAVAETLAEKERV